MKEQLKITTAPDPILSSKAMPVVTFNDDIKKLGNILKVALRQNVDYGIGLAANQLGLRSNIFVVEYLDEEGKCTIPLRFFVNPKIIEKGVETEVLDEGCLSVPNIFLPVERSKKIKVKAQDLNGKKFRLTAKDLFARLIQHETEHLQGKIFTEHIKDKLLGSYPELKKMKIVFIGSGDFAEIISRGLILFGLNIPLIITEISKPTGRKQKLQSTPVALMASKFNKKTLETENIKETITKISEIKPDLIILADFGQIIPQSILKIPVVAAINLHPSLLPKYRGPSPIQTAILKGDKKTGLSIIKMSPRIDEGQIINQKEINIFDDDNAISLEIRLANLGLKMLTELLPKFIKGEIKLVSQDNTLASFTKKFSKTDGEIDWNKTAVDIEHQIRAFFPWPGSYTFTQNKRLIIHQAHLDENRLVLDIVQPEGKKIILFSDFLKGFRGEKPLWFSKIKLEK